MAGMSFWKKMFGTPEKAAEQEVNKVDLSPVSLGWSSQSRNEVLPGSKFVIEPQFAQRWNAYATAAFPDELGAVVRIVETDGVFRAVDFQVLEQEVSPTYFEFTTTGQAQFQMDLATSGRGEELAEWYGLIHSHPNMTPFMSGTDVANLWKLAGNKIGFSLICAASRDPKNNYFSVNYAQGGPVPLMIKNIDHNKPGLGGTGDLDSEQLEAIEAEVKSLTRPRISSWKGSGYVSAPSPNRPLSPSPVDDLAWDEDSLFFAPPVDGGDDDGPPFLSTRDEDRDLVDLGDLSEEELELVVGSLDLHEMVGLAAPVEIEEIILRIESQDGLLSNQADVLLSALGEYPVEEDEEAVQELIDKVSVALDSVEI